MEIPHLSAKQLASYLISSGNSRKNILLDAKNSTGNRAAAILYQDVRKTLQEYLSDSASNTAILNRADLRFSQKAEDPSISSFMRKDAENSIKVLRKMQPLHNQLSGYSFVTVDSRYSKLEVEGVQVSVKTDVLVEGENNRMGAAVLKMTKDNASTDYMINKRKEIGEYLATISLLHARQNLAKESQTADPSLCMCIDIQHGKVFDASQKTVTRIQQIESACWMIAAAWDNI